MTTRRRAAAGIRKTATAAAQPVRTATSRAGCDTRCAGPEPHLQLGLAPVLRGLLFARSLEFLRQRLQVSLLVA